MEDDPDQGRNMERLLARKFEAKIDIARDLGHAREALASREYDAVITDYQLPDGSGLDLLQEITARPVHPPVIMVTGQGDEETAAEAFRRQASGYVVKDSRLPTMVPEILSRTLKEVSLRRAEDELIQREKDQRALLDATPETLMLVDRKGIIVTINETGAKRLGSTPVEMIGTALTDYLDLELGGGRQEQYKIVARTFEPVQFEDEHNGVTLSNVLYPVIGKDGRVARVAIFSRDVTERKKNEEALRVAHEELEERVLERTAQLRQANEKLRLEIDERKRIEESLIALSQRFQDQARVLDQILSSSPQHFYLFDDKGKFIYASKPAADLLGHNQSEFSAKYWWELGFPEDVMRELDVHRENVLRTGEHWVGQLQFPTPSGVREFEYILSPIVRADGVVDTVVATARDVTEEKQAQEELVTRTARLQEQAQLLDLTHETIVVKDMSDRILFWNAGAEEMFGWKREEAIGKVEAELMKTEFSVPLDEVQDILLEEGRWAGELVVRARDGRSLTVASRQVVRWKGGQPDAVLQIDYDISERRILQNELEARVASLDQRAQLIDLVPEPIIMTDMNSVVTLWNTGAEKAFGWTQEEALGKVYLELLKTEFEKPLADIEFELLEDGHWEGSVAYNSKDGRQFKSKTRWALKWDDAGHPEAILQVIC